MIKRIIAITISILMLTFSFTGCIPQHEHEFGNWEVYTPAKCTETGLERRFCNCGEEQQRNIAEKGYYIYSIPVAQQNQTEREARKAPVIQIAVKFSGAIHHSEVIITVER